MNNKSAIISFHPQNSIQLQCELDMRKLLSTETDWKRFKTNWPQFKTNWPQFLNSDHCNRQIFRLKGNKLTYASEQLIPVKKDSRPPLLLVFGNPASHSITAGMFFSFEANGREHRIWKDILRPSNILDLPIDENSPVQKRNEQRKNQLLNLDYDSPFQIGMCVFISMPSAASGPWSGVAGIKSCLVRKL